VRVSSTLLSLDCVSKWTFVKKKCRSFEEEERREKVKKKDRSFAETFGEKKGLRFLFEDSFEGERIASPQKEV